MAWVLKTILDLDLHPHPPVAIMPLGTGNDLARTFRWGGSFSDEWIKNQECIYYTLKRIATAEVRDLDCWKVTMIAPTPNSDEWYEELPHSLNIIEPGKVEGLTWNYISLGMDA